VTYQALVTCVLLLDSEGLGVVQVRPEGDEDCDVFVSARPADKPSLLRVQVKFRSAALGTAELATALVKAWESCTDTEPSRRWIAVCTNHESVDQLPATGWSSPLAEVGRSGAGATAAVEGLIAAVSRAAASRGLDLDPVGLLSRAHLVTISSDLSTLAAQVGRQRSFATPLHEHLASARLLAQALRVAGDNRNASRSSASVMTRHGLRESLDDTAAATGSWLSRVEERQLVAVPSFGRRPAESRSDFLRGLRAQPQHIGAGFAVPRSRWIREVQGLLRDSSSTLIVGPSGSGKSTLMWQTAHASVLGRVLVLNHVTDEDVPELSRFLKLMAPADGPPLLVCADDVDRPALSGWTELLRAVGSDARVQLLGTCRDEFFDPALTGPGIAAIVRPRLDLDEAQVIGSHLLDERATPPSPQDLQLLHTDARGLMLEFVHLATTSTRLSDVLSEQAHRLVTSAPTAEADVARLVLAADVCGLPVPVEWLRTLHFSDAEITRALRRLDSEHVVIEEGGLVRGLHPVRSARLLPDLHSILPRLSETFSHLIALAPVEQLRAVVETWQSLGADDIGRLEAALAKRIRSEPSMDVVDVAELLLRTEASVYARDVRRALPSKDRPLTTALIFGGAGSRTAGMRLLTFGVWETSLGSKTMRDALPAMRRYDELQRQLPRPRPVRRNVVGLLGDRAGRLLTDPASAVQALGLFAGSEAFEVDQLAMLLRACVEIAGSPAPAPGLSYERGASASMVRAQNALWAAACAGAVARTGSAGVVAAASVLGTNQAERVRWMLDKSAIFLRVVDDSSTSGSVDVELLTPGVSVPSATIAEHYMSKLTDAAAVAGLEFVVATLITAEGRRFPADRADPLIGGDSDRVPTWVLLIFVEQHARLAVEGSWFTWLDVVAERLSTTSDAVELMVSVSLETLRRRPSMAALINLQSTVHSAGERLEEPLPLPPSSRVPTGTDDDASAPASFDPRTAVQALRDTLAALLGTCELVRQQLVGVVDDEQMRMGDQVFGFLHGSLTEASRYLEAFRNSTAHVEVLRLLRALDALQALASSSAPSSGSARSRLMRVAVSRSEPKRAVERVVHVLDQVREELRVREERALLDALGEASAGWELISLPARRNLRELPLLSWVALCPPQQTLPLKDLDRVTTAVGGLEGRLFFIARSFDGQWHGPAVAFERAGTWRPVAELHDQLIKHQLHARGVRAGAGSVGARSAAESQLEVLLPLLSRRLAQARLTSRDMPDLGRWFDDLQTLVGRIAGPAKSSYAALVQMVTAEANGAPAAASLAAEEDRYRASHEVGPGLRALSDAQWMARQDARQIGT